MNVRNETKRNERYGDWSTGDLFKFGDSIYTFNGFGSFGGLLACRHSDGVTYLFQTSDGWQRVEPTSKETFRAAALRLIRAGASAGDVLKEWTCAKGHTTLDASLAW